MSTATRRRALVATFVFTVMTLLVGAAPPASAAPFSIHWEVKASTTIKKLGLTASIPKGTLDAQVDLATGAITGHIALPPATTTVKLAGLPLADAKIALTEAKPLTGKLDL